MISKSVKASRQPDESRDLPIVTRFFESHGLISERFTKAETRSGKTPDFRIRKDGKLVSYCEVKSPNDPWLDEKLDSAPAFQIVGGARPDPIFNRLSGLISKAVEQFDAVNPLREVPNILFFVNHDDASSYADLRETLTGEFFAESGARYATMKHVSEGRIKHAKYRVDAYIWYDVTAGKVEGWFFGEENPAHLEAICDMFRLDKSNIRR